MSRAWRFGAPHELRIDSLADRLIHDPALRDELTGQTTHEWHDPIAKRARTWRGWLRELAEDLGNTYADQFTVVIERAVEHVEQTADT